MVMKVLLTGHKGYIGSHLHGVLLKDFDTDTFDESKDFHVWTEGFRGKAAVKPEVIIHCGAIPDLTCRSPDIFIWNYETTRRIADVAATIDAHLIFFSSVAAVEPNTLYGWSKRTAEEYIRTRIAEKYTVLRIFNVYGRENNRFQKSVPWQLAHRTLEQLFDPFVRDYIHVDDVVRSVCHALTERSYGTYQVGTGEGVSVRALAESVGWMPEKITTVSQGLEWDIPEKQIASSAEFLPGFRTTVAVFDAVKGVE